MTEKDFIALYTQANSETKKQVEQLLELNPESTNKITIDLMLINHQDITPIIEHREQLKAIMEKDRKDNCIDAFLLGIMAGKRAERAKKANHRAAIKSEV